MKYKIYFKSRYYPLEGMHTKTVQVPDSTKKAQIRAMWPDIIHTDEYVIKKVEEVKES